MMSAMDPPLHERVYEGLKEDYLAGHFVPGKKIDIQELATRHRSSKTPVREAAFILVGEGLLTHHSDGGFLVPDLDPHEIIELLAFHMQLMQSILSALKEASVRAALQQIVGSRSTSTPASIANLATAIFSGLAEASGNRQASIQVRRINERLHYSRIAETNDLDVAVKELATISSLEVANLLKATRRRVEVYHMRKIAHQRELVQIQARAKY